MLSRKCAQLHDHHLLTDKFLLHARLAAVLETVNASKAEAVLLLAQLRTAGVTSSCEVPQAVRESL